MRIYNLFGLRNLFSRPHYIGFAMPTILFLFINACQPELYSYRLEMDIHLHQGYKLTIIADLFVAEKWELKGIKNNSSKIKQALQMSLRQIDPVNIHMMNKLRAGFILEKICDQFLKVDVKKVQVVQFTVQQNQLSKT